MASEDYNEDEFTTLNDIENVLNTVGIKLRENYGTYRSTEAVLEDIAEIWDTISQTQQNAITTALAGKYVA